LSRPGAPTGRPPRVLVVEDSEDDAALLTRELGRGGYDPLLLERVDTPEGMERALREADGRGEPFEVVISDYYMPRFKLGAHSRLQALVFAVRHGGVEIR